MRIGASVSHDLAVISLPRGERTVRVLLICDIFASCKKEGRHRDTENTQLLRVSVSLW